MLEVIDLLYLYTSSPSVVINKYECVGTTYVPIQAFDEETIVAQRRLLWLVSQRICLYFVYILIKRLRVKVCTHSALRALSFIL